MDRASSGNGINRRAIIRSRTGCQTCRRRRLKVRPDQSYMQQSLPSPLTSLLWLASCLSPDSLAVR